VNNIERLRTVAASALIIVTMGCAVNSGSTGTVGSVGPSVPSPTEVPTLPLFANQEGGGTALPPGSYVILLAPLRITITVPAGWSKGRYDWAVFSDRSPISIAFFTVKDLYLDPCAVDRGLRQPPVGPSVGDLASALGDVPSLDATAPSDVSLAGFVGLRMDLIAPETWEGCEEEDNEGQIWETSGGAHPRLAPETHVQLWILDVEGTRLVLAVLENEAGPAAVAETHAIVDAIQIEP
jgi:hypothetical protein